MASVIHLARLVISPTVSLYVNSFNTPAMRSYASVGFRPYGHFATVLLQLSSGEIFGKDAHVILRMSTLLLRTLRMTRPMLKCPATDCWCGPDTSDVSPPGCSPGCRSVTRRSAMSSGSSGRKWTTPAFRKCISLIQEPYEATGRWTEYGINLFRLQDRRGSDYLLGPTHEELFTQMVRGVLSIRTFKLVIYQIQTKYRDEARPRAGILRGREFVMKDSYSFDVDDAGLEHSYGRHRDAYISTFDRLGLTYVIVSAMSGAMGGSASEEFLAPTPVGEDTFVRCPECGFAANVEAISVPVAVEQPVAVGAAHVENTPDTPTIDTLVEVSNSRPEFARSDGDAWLASDTLKTSS